LNLEKNCVVKKQLKLVIVWS